MKQIVLPFALFCALGACQFDDEKTVDSSVQASKGEANYVPWERRPRILWPSGVRAPVAFSGVFVDRAGRLGENVMFGFDGSNGDFVFAYYSGRASQNAMIDVAIAQGGMGIVPGTNESAGVLKPPKIGPGGPIVPGDIVALGSRFSTSVEEARQTLQDGFDELEF